MDPENNSTQQPTKDQRMVGAWEAAQAQVLARIDERTLAMAQSFSEFKTSVDKKIDELKSEVKTDVANIEKRLNDKVSNETFKPVKAITYGLATLILLAVGGLIINNAIAPKNVTVIEAPVKPSKN